MAKNDYKLTFIIDADGSTAKQALNGLTADINKFGGTYTSTFGGMIPIAGAVAGAIAGIGTAAAGAGIALFNITKNAAEFGSTIFDASQKTGLGATAISSLKVAADQSGSSLEAVTRGIARFAKNYEGTGKDLRTELGRVFKQINEAAPGFDQMRIAQAKFGKGGADLIPVIKATSGNLEEFIKKAEELGITIDDKAAYQADQFGDQLDTLNAQLAGVGRTIGGELMPVFNDMASATSTFISSNRSEIGIWGRETANVLRGIAAYWRDATVAMSGYRAFDKNALPGNVSPAAGLLSMTPLGSAYLGLSRAWNMAADRGAAEPTQMGPYAWEMSPTSRRSVGGDGPGSGKIKRPPKESDGEFRKFFDELGFSIVRTYGKAINDGSPHTYGGAADISIKGQSMDRIFTLMAKALEKGYRVFDERLKAPGVKQTGPHIHIENAKTSLTKDSRILGLGLTSDQLAYLKNLDQERLGKASGTAGLDQFTKKRAEDEKRTADKTYENERLAASRRLELGQALTNDLIDQYETLYQKAVEVNDPTQAIAAAKYLHDLKIQYIDDEIAGLDEVWRSAEIGSEKEAEAWHKLQLATIARNAAQRKADEVLAEQRKKITEKQIDDALKLQEKALADFEAFAATLENKAHTTGYSMVDDAAARGRKRLADKNTAHPLSDGIFGSLGISKMQTEADIVSGIYGRMGSMVGDTVNQMAQGVGSMVEQWVLYGSAGPDAMRKMTASVLAGLAAQAAVESLMELAKGIASLANPFTAWQAPFHFKAAAIFGGIAVGSALAGRAVAGDSFTKGNASSSGSASGSTGSTGSASVMPSSRVSANAFTSGRDSSTVQLAASIDRLERKISGMRPGDVLVAGAREKRGFIGEQNTRDIQSNAKIGVNQAKAMGMR